MFIKYGKFKVWICSLQVLQQAGLQAVPQRFLHFFQGIDFAEGLYGFGWRSGGVLVEVEGKCCFHVVEVCSYSTRIAPSTGRGNT
jgi:hypothetical protein